MASLFTDQVVPITTTATFSFPSNWQPQSQSVETFFLMPHSEEWKVCADKLKISLHAVVTTIVRIQNLWLWEGYSFTKERMWKKNHGRINEMDLFHGTGSNQPMEIVCSEDGLDVRHSCKGSWGYAIYLAETASYANQFAHKLSSGESEILIVKALVGEAYDCGNKRNQQLKYPPIRHTKLNALVNVRYA